ncbi:MAG: MFS transporter, partial [Pseudomonadota bacterium]
MAQTHPIARARELPFWRRPITLLFLMAAAMPIAFSTWLALLNNFVIDAAAFDGADIGLLHTVREIPGFLAVGVIAVLLFMREQVLGMASLFLLGAATALTAQFPQIQGILILTFLSSVGFHYYETVNQSLQLQWLPKEDAPRILGWLLAAGSVSTFLVYFVIMVLWEPLNLTYNIVYLVGGGVTAAIALFAWVAYPQFEAPHPQKKQMILRRRYWLYYALQFMSGARRQIFVVFAGFMMVERFGFDVHELTALYLINLVVNIFAAPLLGRVVQHYGERNALGFEYIGLVLVFLAYGGVYYLGWGLMVAAALYVIDHIFFGLALALKTYFQKIADPGDIAPTA